MKKIIFLFIILHIIPSISFACSCILYSSDPNKAVKAKYNDFSSIVLAKAESIKKIEINTSWTKEINFKNKGEETYFSSVQSWKGDHGKKFHTKVITESTMCGTRFVTGETYLLFLSRSKKGGYYTTSSCSGNIGLSQAKEHIRALNKLSPNN